MLPLSAAIALTVLATPLVTPLGSSAHADSSSVTATGRDNAYDPATKTLRSAPPTATAQQTENLVDQTVHVAWTGETPSSVNGSNLADTTDATINTANLANTYYGVGVFECKGAAPTSFADCYATPAGATFGSGGLGNAVYALTYPDGTGYADLHVETGVTNSALLCDTATPCSAVVIPAWGGTQDGTGSAADCAKHKTDGASSGTAVSTQISFGACSWAERIVVPLHFAATPTDCPEAQSAFTAVGSPMLQRGLTQWKSGWCTDATPLSFTYTSDSNEYLARDSFVSGAGALTSATDVALVTQPVASSVKTFTYAPLTNTDIAVAFLIDDPKTRAKITDLTLNARLMAKLLTQSYAPLAYNCTGANPTVQGPSCDPAVKGNPASIFTDPEFRALNPELSTTDFPYQGYNAVGAYLPTVVAGNSDLTYELTRWIASDKDAKAFLAGTPDASGMHINTYYKGIQFPTSQMQQVDPGYTDTSAGALAGNGTMQNAWQPVTGLDMVGTLLVGNKSSGLVPAVNVSCDNPPCSIPKIGEYNGQRSLFAVLDQGQASAYNFPTAHLVNAAGKPVAPDATSIAAGIATATTNADGITQQPNFTSTAAGDYPLTVTDYAVVRTCGQSAATAAAVTSMLGKVAESQTSGVQPGTLAPGYTAMTTAQLTQLAAARKAVGSAACPKPRAPISPPGDTSTSTNSGSSNSGGFGNGSTGSAGGTGTGSGAGLAGGSSSAHGVSAAAIKAASGGKATSSTGQPAGTKPRATAFSVHPDRAGAARFALPVLLIVGAVLLLAGPGAFVALNTGAGASAARWVKGLRR